MNIQLNYNIQKNIEKDIQSTWKPLLKEPQEKERAIDFLKSYNLRITSPEIFKSIKQLSP